MIYTNLSKEVWITHLYQLLQRELEREKALLDKHTDGMYCFNNRASPAIIVNRVFSSRYLVMC